MSNTIDIFNSAKLNVANLTGSNNFFSSIGEITESAKLQNKFISNVDYSQPENFAKFGLAEEYYKSAINYIATEYPFDSYTEAKNKWINSLTELEYYLLNKEFPTHLGHLQLSSSQYIKAYSPSRDMADINIKNIYNNGEKYFVKEFLNFNDGVTFESWIKFDDINNTPQILNINTVFSNSLGVSDIELFKVYATSSNIHISGGLGDSAFSYVLASGSWNHYAVSVNKDSSSLFVNGALQEKIPSTFINTANEYVFYKTGLILTTLTSSFTSTGSYTKQPVFKFGSGSNISFDEIRFWNKEKTIEKIGRYWFTQVDGNNFNTVDSSDLLLYYKFNEGWDDISGSYCLDYSGFKNHAIINNYSSSCRISSSAINESGLVQDVEQGNIIYVPTLSSSTDILVPFYESKISSGSAHDIANRNALYKKFPSWILEEEQEREVQHLKQTIQIISSYFDDLYNKIAEISNYKHIKHTEDKDKIYPFYDKILTSAGFDVTELFSNLNFIEKIASRTDVNLFDEDISKIKNTIYQNIYNNLSYILKSKGTEKSLRSFLRSYGINENLVRINLYADKSKYTVSDKYSETVVKKKTITLTGSANVYLSGTTTSVGNYFSLETAAIFPKNLKNNTADTGSVMGLFISNPTSTYSNNTSSLQAYITVEHTAEGDRFCFRTGSTKDLVYTSPTYSDLYDDTIWNFAIGFLPNVDNLETADSTYNYLLDFRAINTYKEGLQYISSSTVSTPVSGNYSGDLRYFIGADNTEITGANIYKANTKYLYCNYWTKYISDYELASHNRDIFNYGIE
jgi:hypothetical protein